jgi:hypothetical protein
MIGRFPCFVEEASRALHGAMVNRPHLRHRPVIQKTNTLELFKDCDAMYHQRLMIG